ncbi:MAG: (2Fe-2S)-binding protein [Burkholderiaceae bacterium]
MRCRVNHRETAINATAERLLVQWLREDLGLTGTHVGCDTGQCGACTVLIDGEPVKACLTLAVQCDGCNLTTIEGLAPAEDELHPMQQAFIDHDALQCGFCTPGMIMRAIALAEEPVANTPEAIARAISGNLCRCTGYVPIVAAIRAGLDAMRAGGSGSIE